MSQGKTMNDLMVTGHQMVRQLTYVYLNHTAPADGEAPRNSFVGQGFDLRMEETVPGEYVLLDFHEPGAPGQPDVIRMKDSGNVITVAPGWLWREERDVKKPIYALKGTPKP